jgi:uncharacterized protein (TIGR03086 family)
VSPDQNVTELIQAGRDREAAQRALSSRPSEQNGGTVDPLTQLGQLGPALGGVIAGLTSDDLDRPTPCAAYTVRGVLEHMINGGTAFAAAYRGETPTEPDLSDPINGVQAMLGDLVAAMSAPGALDRTIAAPFGEVPGDTFARFVVLDGLVHGWDMAEATGQRYEPADELVAAVDAFAHQAIDPLRNGDTFADAVEPAAGATAMDRLAAYTGRRPLAAAG